MYILPHNHTATRTIDTNTITATIPPYIHRLKLPSYRLHLLVCLNGNPNSTAHLKSRIFFRSATPTCVQNLLETVDLIQCKQCNTVRFDPKTVEFKTQPTCETCSHQKQAKLLADKKAKEAQREYRCDLKHKRKGATHKLAAQIHPLLKHRKPYTLTLYFDHEVQPETALRIIAARQSIIQDDYVISKL